MKRNTRRRWIGMLSLGLIAVAAIVVGLLAPWQSYSMGTVFAGTNDDRFTATGYSDVIRFQAEGVATLQVRIFDLSGKEIWGSGVVSGDIVDWDRRNDTGERLAYGAYIYSAQGWNVQGDLIFQKNGKLALMPGDKVQLQAAPVPTAESSLPAQTLDVSLQPKTHTVDDNMQVNGRVTTQTTVGDNFFTVKSGTGAGGDRAGCKFVGYDPTNSGDYAYFQFRTDFGDINLSAKDVSTGTFHSAFNFYYLQDHFDFRRNQVDNIGSLGVGTSGAGVTAKVTVQGTSGDLIAAYNSTNRVFVVKSTGEVRADGAYYSGAGDCNTGGFNAGGADVAERINTSEWVEPGNVVEIDPAHPGFFRKSSSSYSTKVAGIISTSPGVILGNNFDEATDDWEDNRPVLAVTGRVPCKVSAENGPIQIGDLLVASSIPGIAMKGDPEEAIGAVVGKAMEPLAEGEGTIVVQVMLR